MTIEYTSTLLERVNIPDFQRSVDMEHVQHIYQDIADALERHEDPKLDTIKLALCDDTTYLLDGQHRLIAYERILNDFGHDLNPYVQTCIVNSEEQAEQLFNKANTCLPVSIMPKGVKRSGINQIAEFFYQRSAPKKGAPLFRGSGTNRPRIQKSKFEETLAKIVKANPTMTTTAIIDKIVEYEQQLNRKTYTFFKRKSDNDKKIIGMIEKADMLGSRLGLVPLREIVRIFGVDEPPPRFEKRENIPKALRMRVWDTYCGTEVRHSHCPFCKERISLDNWHCAHDTAAAHGGDIGIDNLYPCCGGCNLSMGTATFEEFLRKMRNIEPERPESSERVLITVQQRA